MTTPSKYAELDKLESALDHEIAHLHRQRTTNLIIGIVLAVLILGYFVVMSWRARNMMEPQEIAAMATHRVVLYLPNARVNLEEAARKEVPLLVDAMIDQLLRDSLPDIRVRLRAVIVESAEQAMDDAENEFFTQITQHLKTHGAALRSLSDDLTTSEGAQAFEDAIYKTLDDVAQDPEVQADLLGYGAALQHLEGALEYLAQDKITLTPEEESLRELISIFRELMNRERNAPAS